jgi:hypothetical protein
MCHSGLQKTLRQNRPDLLGIFDDTAAADEA